MLSRGGDDEYISSHEYTCFLGYGVWRSIRKGREDFSGHISFKVGEEAELVFEHISGIGRTS